ncbi:MAG: hypothetical protein Q8L87_14200 [Anaerolineales bacterium]|nr:hypothetical protein [Anaerolineales bacterium]
MSGFLNWLLSLFKPTPKKETTDNNPTEPAQITRSKVLLIVYDPVMDPATGITLSQQMRWYNTSDLVTGFMADLLETSNGLARYEIVQRIDVDEFPAKTDGFRYTPQSYLDVMRRAATPHMPQEVNYHAILGKFNILPRVASNEIDEVWIFGFPHAGFYESTMGGPGAFWCNAPQLANTSASKRRFVVMGFSYERHIGEMFESYGHRAESIMERTFMKLTGEANLWRRFIRYEKIAPGKAACGNIHFAPNSQSDYDWNNPVPVNSECYDWLLNFPNFKGDVRAVTASEWGSGDIRAHHKWWFNHFPRVNGRRNGIHNNWWQYVVSPQNVII